MDTVKQIQENKTVCQQLLERFFDSDASVTVDELLAECPEQEREKLRYAFAALDAMAHFEEPVPELSDEAVAQGQMRLSLLRRRETIRSSWSVPPSPKSIERVAKATLEIKQSPNSTAFSMNPVGTMARALGISGNAISMNRELGTASRLSPLDEPLLEKEQWISEEAELILKSAGALYAPVPKQFEKICKYIGLTAIETSLQDTRLDGCLVTDGEVGGVVVNKTMRVAARRNFTYAHEIGHYILHRSLASKFEDEIANLSDFSGGVEHEANMFASFLLVPPSILRKYYNPQNAPTLTQVHGLVDSCGISQLAAMYRLVRAAERPCVLLVFQSGRVSWNVASPFF